MKRLAAALCGVLCALLLPSELIAQVYGGPGLSTPPAPAGVLTGDPVTIAIAIVTNVRTVVAVVAGLAIVVAGVYLLLGFGNEQSRDKAKQIVLYAAVGVGLIFLAEQIVRMVLFLIGGTGGDTSLLVAVGNFINAVETLLLTFATLALVVAGLYIILGFGNEGNRDTAKRIVIYTAIGIALILLAGDIYNFIFALVKTGSLSGGGLLGKIQAFTDNLATPLLIISTLALVIAGLYLILGFGNEGNRDTAKRIVIFTAVGIALILLANPIAQFFQGLADGSVQGGGLLGKITTLTASIKNIVLTLAILALVVAGLYLILGFGNEGNRDTAKRIVIFTAVGIVLVFLSDPIIQFFRGLADGSVQGGGLLEIVRSFITDIQTPALVLAALGLVVAGLYLILGFGNEGNRDTAKRIVIFSAVGIVLIFLANPIVQFFQGLAAGNVEGGGLLEIVRSFITDIQTPVLVLAALGLVVAGLYLILGFGNEGNRDTAKRIVIFSAVGIVLIFLANPIVQFFQGLTSGNVEGGGLLGIITGLIPLLLNIALVLAVLAVVIGGVRLIIGFGSDESRDAAKKIIIYALVGIVIIILAYTIVGIVAGIINEATA